MAIKQTSVENDDNVEIKRPSYQLQTVLNFINSFQPKHQQEFLSLEVFKNLVNMLVFIEAPTQIALKENLPKFRENVKKVENFIKIHPSSMPEFVAAFFSIILKTEKPSGVAGIILNNFQSYDIAIPTPHEPDDMIFKGVTILCNWIIYSFFIDNLDVWINGIIDRIHQQNRSALLSKIVVNNFGSILQLCKVPLYQKTASTICQKMISAIQNDNDAIKKVCELMRVDPRNLIPFLQNYQSNTAEKPQNYGNKLRISSNNYGHPLRNKNYDLVGLVNLGNTCYMNSILQALVVTKQFSREILLSETRGTLFSNIQKLLALLLHSNRRTLTPTAVLQTARPPGFKPGHQQDSSEFLGHLLDALHEQEKIFLHKNEMQNFNGVGGGGGHAKQQKCISATITSGSIDGGGGVNENNVNMMMDIDDNDLVTNCDDDDDDEDMERVQGAHALMPSTSTQQHYGGGGNRSKSPKTIIQRTFSGNMTVTYKCLNCCSESKQYDSFRDFQLSFPDTDSTTKTFSIRNLLEYNCEAEKLINDNQYACEQCKMLCDGERYTNIINAPEYLILTVKYFKYDQKYNTRTKLMHKVKHDETISIKVQQQQQLDGANVDGQTINRCNNYDTTKMVDYQLYCAVIHSGVSLDAGHYFTYAAVQSNLWFRFEDSHVSSSSVDELNNLQPPNTPYILFYKRITNDSSTSLSSSASTSPSTPTQLLCDMPALEELPPNLREYVNRENVSDENESRQRLQLNSKPSSFRHHPDSDNDDQPPPSSSCGNNSLQTNRFVF